MDNVTIVKLAPGGNVPNVSFEDAFGEFSEARGKGRDRRAARKSDKRQKKTTKKLERIESKDEVKRTRREGKINRRGDRKTLRKTNRQDRKTGTMEMRQGRKTNRKGLRQERRKLGDEPELEMDNQTSTETGNGYQDNSDSGYQDEQTGGSGQGELNQEGDSTGDNSGNGQGEYQTTQAGDYEEGQEEEGNYDDSSEEEGDYDESAEEEGDYEDDSDIEQGDYEDDSYGEDDDYGFDGVMGAEDRFSEASDSTKPTVNIDPSVNDIAKRIEWQKQRISALRVKKAEIMGRNGSTQKIEQAINDSVLRLSELTTLLKKYSNFEVDFSAADGKPCKCACKNPSQAMRQQRGREVGKAKRLAREGRMAYNQSKKSAKKADIAQAKARQKQNGGDVTPVEIELNPEITNQRIVVPGRSNATGTGLNGLDNMEDSDAPDIRVVELSSNATGPGSGPGMKINWRAVGIGAVIAVVFIVGYQYYKKSKK